jgi:hypothetical protein
MKPKTNLFKLLLVAILAIGSYTAQAQLQVSASTTSSCNNDGQIVVTASGGTAPYSYTLASYYSNNTFNQITQAGPVFTGIPLGQYVITVTDATGLNNVLQPSYAYVGATFNVNVYISAAAVCPSNVGSESVHVYGGTGYTYLWSNGSTTQTITNVPVGSQYSLTVTNTATGCIATGTDSFGSYPTMYQTSSVTGSITTTAANCTNGTATVTGANGTSPYTYLWANGQTTSTATGFSAGSYNVTVTDAQGCSAVPYAYITQGIVISTSTNTNAETCNQGNGTASVTALNGTAPFTYLWSTGNTTSTVSGLAGSYYGQYYYVTVTDHSGCTASAYVNVQKSTPISLTTSTTVSLCTSNTGTATVTASGGTLPYGYVWGTNPVQATATATALPAGYYAVTVTDALGCLQIQSATVSNNTTLAMSLSKTDAVCGGIAGTVDAYVSGGNAPYAYIWSTGATTHNIGGIQQEGTYGCQITDAVGCTVSQYTCVQVTSPILISFTTNNSSCLYTADGSATLFAYGGTPPYTYYFSNGQTTQTATTLLSGYYSAYVTDASGCSSGGWFNIGYNSILPCAVSISGTVYNDYNANCQVDGPDYGLQNVWVGCFPNAGYQWTDQSGSFDFILPPGSYSLAQSPPLYHTAICPATPPTVTLTAGQSDANYNFFNQPDSVTDLIINCIPYCVPVAGFDQHIALIVGNLGTFAQNPDVVYMSSTDVSFLYSNPPPTTYDPATGALTWNGPLLFANGVNVIDMYFNIPSALPTGHILNNSDTVYPIVGDYEPYNNYGTYEGYVVRSFDPNYIDVQPTGAGTPGYIHTTDSVLRYVVHFQNTGTTSATYVTLKIPVDPNLDIATFNYIGASVRPSKISADKNGLLTIEFDNIDLVDSSVSWLGSQGFAAFTFKQKAGLAQLAQIHESANIYFDYNTAVPTDTVLNTIYGPNGIKPVESGTLQVYPNPTSGSVTVDLSAINENMKAITIYDISGRAVINMPVNDASANKLYTVNTAPLGAGVYIVEVTGNSKYVQKIVKTE